MLYLKIFTVVSWSCFIAVLPAYGQDWYLKPFSAIFEETDEGQTDTLKYFVGDRKIRMEMNQDGEQMVMLFHFVVEGGKAYMLMPSQKMYMQVPIDGEDNEALRALVTPIRSPLHPCSSKWSCKNLGRETVAGRAAEKYEMTYEGEKTVIWIDSDLHFPVLVRDENDEGVYSEMKLLEVVPGPQPAHLFELPKDYQSFSY